MLFFKKNKPNRSAQTMSTELQKLRDLHRMAQTLIETYNNAVRDLDGLTVQQVEQAYHSGRLTKIEYEELSNAVAALEQIVTGHPALILNVQSKYAQEYLTLSQTHDLSSFPEPSFFTPPKEHTPSNPPESVTLALDNVVLPCNLTDEERAYAKRRFCVQTNEEVEERYYSLLEPWLDRIIDKLAANFDSEILPEDCIAGCFLSSPFYVSPPFPYKNKFLLCDMTIFASLTALGGIPDNVLPESGKAYIIDQMQTLFCEVFGVEQNVSSFMWENRIDTYNSMCETLSVDELPKTCLTLMQYSYAYSRELVYAVNAGYPRVFEHTNKGESNALPLAMPLIDIGDVLELKKRYEEMVQYCRYHMRKLIEEDQQS